MLQKPFKGNYSATLEFGQSYNGILGLGNTKHRGIDFCMPEGTEILSPGNGEVISVNTCANCSDYGIYIQLKIGELWVYLSHLSEFHIEVGQKVVAGQVIGKSGNTGRSTGPHLDIRVHDLGKFNEPMKDFQNPREYIDFSAEPTKTVSPQEEAHEPQENCQMRTYEVVSGDTLWRISKNFYGQGSKWQRIFVANQDKIDDPNLIHPGLILNIPE